MGKGREKEKGRAAGRLAAALFFACLGRARAASSAGADFTTGQGYRGFELRGALDLGAKADWTGRVSYAHVHSTQGTESRSNHFRLGASHIVDADWDARGSVAFWKDSVSNVRYWGPSFGATRSWSEGESETLAVSLDSDLFFYSTDAVSSSRSVFVGGSRRILRPHSTKVGVTQFHPTLTIEKPLNDGRIVPALAAGHYFYSRNPDAIEQLAGRPRFAASSGRLSELAGGFFKNNVLVSVDVQLPARTLVRAALGADQLATDGSWATLQQILLEHTIAKTWRAGVEWSRSIQDGFPLDLFTLSGTYLF